MSGTSGFQLGNTDRKDKMVKTNAKWMGWYAALTILAGSVLTGCPPPDTLYSFAVIADPHVYSNPESGARLASCVEWINAVEEEKLVEFVFVVGDLGRFAEVKAILDGLAVPYVPIIGDNDVIASDEDFDMVFAPQYEHLATVLENWQRQPTPVWNPEVEEYSYFQNFSFDHRGVHFMGIDWCSRTDGSIDKEQADLHDFEGGTWPWFVEYITNCDKEMLENIVMLTHHPMHVAPVIPLEIVSFSIEEDETINLFTGVYGDHVYANMAGHYHVWWHEYRELGQYELFVTEATHLLGNTLRLVHVYNDGEGFSYFHVPLVID